MGRMREGPRVETRPQRGLQERRRPAPPAPSRPPRALRSCGTSTRAAWPCTCRPVRQRACGAFAVGGNTGWRGPLLQPPWPRCRRALWRFPPLCPASLTSTARLTCPFPLIKPPSRPPPPRRTGLTSLSSSHSRCCWRPAGCGCADGDGAAKVHCSSSVRPTRACDPRRSACWPWAPTTRTGRSCCRPKTCFSTPPPSSCGAPARAHTRAAPWGDRLDLHHTRHQLQPHPCTTRGRPPTAADAFHHHHPSLPSQGPAAAAHHPALRRRGRAAHGYQPHDARGEARARRPHPQPRG